MKTFAANFSAGADRAEKIFHWLGFSETRIHFYRKRAPNDARPQHLRKDVGHIAIVAAQIEGMLASVPEAEPVEICEHGWLPVENNR